jgi:hypothetical protein
MLTTQQFDVSAGGGAALRFINFHIETVAQSLAQRQVCGGHSYWKANKISVGA